MVDTGSSRSPTKEELIIRVHSLNTELERAKNRLAEQERQNEILREKLRTLSAELDLKKQTVKSQRAHIGSQAYELESLKKKQENTLMHDIFVSVSMLSLIISIVLIALQVIMQLLETP